MTIIGNYATVSKPLPWFNKTVKTAKKKKTAKVQKVIHPIFVECSKVVGDPFWKDFFIRMSKNKLPKGFRIKGNTLVCHDRTKTKHINFTDDILETASKCMQFLKEIANIMSMTDREEVRRNQIEEMKKANIPKVWSEIKKKKSEKRAAIIQYVSELTREYNLTLFESTDLLTLINLSYFLGQIGNDDVSYEKGHITEIRGLIRIDNKFKLDDEHGKKRYKSRDKEIISNNLRHEYRCSLSDVWAKIIAKKSGLTKAKVLRAITVARTNTERSNTCST
uniref:Uncharacterized protein n=1 Tax=Pithovirus LCPAC404 TaxID=2506597 RepID=A0A481ZEU8_9VIRU|nr:MAG: uncharacterized protein LCPAC404_03040 [Pithovirus LCPAC404]